VLPRGIADTLRMTIRVSDRRLLGPLMEALQLAGCRAAPVGDDRCRVTADGPDRAQAYLELRFFVRAWAKGHGAEVQVEA
jgi:hypothetical protein